MDKDEGFLENALGTLRRRKWVILQATIAIPLLALIFSVLQTEEYTATATLLFRQTPTALGTSTVVDPTREAATNGELVALPVVAKEAADALGDEYSYGEVLSSVAVEPSQEADTASIEATTDSPSRSSRIANAYGAAYIRFRRAADRSQVQEAIDLAESSLEGLSLEQQEGTEGVALRRQLDELKLTQALQTGGAELVQPATPPGSPSSPKTTRNVALGIVLGFILGCALAALLDRFDRRVRTVEEMESLYKLPVLARIPRSRRLASLVQGAVEPKSPEGEAFRALRANLRYFNLKQESQVILVVSPAEGDGKSTVAMSLAEAMVEMGDSVALVEGDLRKGTRLRGTKRLATMGLAKVLAGQPVEEALARVDVRGRNLAVLASGPPPPNPAELLEGERMGEVVAELKDHFDIVILDSPAMGVVSDALALIPLASTILIVGGLGKTTRDQLQAVKNQFNLLGERPSGIVVNFTKTESARYSQYFRTDSTQSGTSVT